MVANTAFLQACFGTDWQDAHVCSFEMDPNTAGPLWAGDRWSRMRDPGGLAGQNSYFVISLFGDDTATGRALRRKALFQAMHVVVIDDVGTKVPMARVPAALPAPSWELETSPGNFQWGYILATPETDAARAAGLLDMMVATGLATDGKDPGMKGVTRYVRLPEGRNTKAKYGSGGFNCRMVAWRPSSRFAADALAAAFGFTLPAPGAVTVGGVRVPIRAEDDQIFGYLDGWGLIHGRASGPGAYDIECPWLAEHTGGADTGAAFWAGGGFKCHHGHCDTRGRAELLSWVDARLRAERGKGLAALDFEGADKPQIDAFWSALASGRVPTRDEIKALSRVPNCRDVDAMLEAAEAITGTDAAALRRKLSRARAHDAQQAKAAARAALIGRPVAVPEGTAALVTLAELQHMADPLDALGDFDASAPVLFKRRRERV